MTDTITNSLVYDGLIAGNFPVERDTVTIKSGEDYDRGTVLGKEDGTSAVVTASNDGTYDLAASDTLVVAVDAGSNQTATYAATQGSVTDTTSYPVGDQTTKTEKITVDGGDEQTITFGTATTALQVAADINDQIVGASAVVTGTQVVLTSDSAGTGSTIAIGTGTTDLTWDTAVAGTGDVVDINAVTVAEVLAIFVTDITGATGAASGGAFTLTSDTFGTTSSIEIVSGNCAAIFGLSIATTTGTGGSGNFIVCDKDGEDGSEDPACVLAEDCDASLGALVAPVYRTGDFESGDLVFASGTVFGDMREKMAAKSMFIKTANS